MRINVWGKAAIFSICMIGFFVAGAYASDGVKKVEAFLRSDFTVKVNGVTAQLSAPLIYNGHTYLRLTELGFAIGADVVWEGSTKTIYVNQRIYDTQPKPVEEVMDEMVFSFLHAEKVIYLGRDYEILVNTDHNGERNFREKDLQRMGIDTSGLKKRKEHWTGEIYIVESEARRAWVEKPKEDYISSVTPVAGEYNSEKLKVLRDYRLTYLVDPSKTDDPNDFQYYNDIQLRGTQIYIIDPIPESENEYVGLFYFKGQYRLLYLTLSQVEEPIPGTAEKQLVWTVSSARSEILGPLDVEDPWNNLSPSYIP